MKPAERSHADWKRLLADQSLPLAWVDLDALDRNTTALLQRAGSLPIRIATKSVRARWLLEYLLSASPRLQGLMTWSAAETVWLAEQGFDDLLLAYPSTEREALHQIAQMVGQGKTIRIMTDSLAHATLLATLARSAGVVLPVCLDIDLSSDYPGLHFGVWRSPLRSLVAVRELVTQVQHMPELRIEAAMGYEAQIAGVGDNQPGQGARNWLVRLLKQRALPQIEARREEVRALLTELGVHLALFNGGGTGSLESTARDPAVTELTAGSGFFNPTLFDHYQAFRHEPAAGFALPAVRFPAPGLVTCFAGGYIASGSVGPEKLPTPFSPAGLALLPLEGAGEVQTPLRDSGSEPFALGDPILFRHAKAGELCERFNQLVLIRKGEVFRHTPTYRGEGHCFG